MTSHLHAYVLLTAARNEARYIGKVIAAVASQTILPVRWVIVDDGSVDGTGQAVRDAGAKLPFLVCVRRHEAKAKRDFRSKAAALQLAWEHVARESFNYVGVLDADLVPPSDYYYQIMALFQRDPRLGVAGGWILEGKDGALRPRKANRSRSVAGGCQVFQRACYEMIGGIPSLPYGGEDTLAAIHAEMRGWMIYASADLPLHHLRPTGASQGDSLRSAVLEGKREYHLGYHPLFTLAKAVRRILEQPFFIRSFCRVAGSISCLLRREKRHATYSAVRHLRARQMHLLGLSAISRESLTRPPPGCDK